MKLARVDSRASKSRSHHILKEESNLCVGPRLQSPVLVCFDDHKTYIVISTNHVCCFRVLMILGAFFPKGRCVDSSHLISGSSFKLARSHMEKPT